jgi:hypothetical protein
MREVLFFQLSVWRQKLRKGLFVFKEQPSYNWQLGLFMFSLSVKKSLRSEK